MLVPFGGRSVCYVLHPCHMLCIAHLILGAVAYCVLHRKYIVSFWGVSCVLRIANTSFFADSIFSTLPCHNCCSLEYFLVIVLDY